MHKRIWNSCIILNFRYTSNQTVAPQEKPKGDHDGLKLLFGATIRLLVLRKRTQLTMMLLIESAQNSFRAEDPFAVNARFFILYRPFCKHFWVNGNHLTFNLGQQDVGILENASHSLAFFLYDTTHFLIYLMSDFLRQFARDADRHIGVHWFADRPPWAGH